MSIDNNDVRARRLLVRAAFAGPLFWGLASGIAIGHTAASDAARPGPVSSIAVAGMPLTFERNAGQAPAGIQYLAHGRACAIALTEQGATLTLTSGGTGNPAVAEQIRLQVHGGSPTARPAAEASLPGRINYLIGNDPSKWLTNLETFGRVRYHAVYPGVDLLYYGTDGRLEYDFSVAPHADARQIGLVFAGADRLHVDSRGALQIGKGERGLTFERPFAYQVISGRRHPVRASYRADGDVIRFQLGAYDHSRALIIDPVLSYFSYLGGSNSDVIGKAAPQVSQVSGQAAAVDSAGDLYVAGYTASTNFPTQAPVAPAPTKTSGTTWAFVTKFAPDAKSLIFSTYIGGTNGSDAGYGIAADASGNTFVVGQAGSSDFPTTSGAYLRICSPTYVNSPNNPFSGCGNNNGNESFVVKLSPSGTLLASTFLGGTHTLSGATAVAIDSGGRPYVVGTTLPGENIPTAIGGSNQQVGFQTTAGAIVAAYPFIANVPVNGGLQYDAYVSVFDPTLATLLYSTLIGDDRPQNGTVQFTSQASTFGTSVAVDPSGNFYLAGYTADTYLPTTTGSVQMLASTCGAETAGTPNSLGGNCGFVAKFSPVGGANPPSLTYATYLGGQPSGANASWNDEITGIAADAAGDAYVVGYASEAGFPTTTGAYQTTCNGFTGSNFGNLYCSSAFVSKLNSAGSALLASTYFGCITCNADDVYTSGAIALDASDNIYIAGFGGNSLPVVNGFASNNTSGGAAPFVAELDSSLTTLKFSTFVNVGNAGQISPAGLALDSSGDIYVAGNVNSPASSAATNGAFQSAYGGGSSDGFVAKIIVTAATQTTLSVSPTSATTGTLVTLTATVAETSGTALPTGTVTFSNGTTTLGTGTLNSSGITTYTTSSLAVGTYSLTASYGGDASNNASSSSAASLTVSAPPPPPPSPTVTMSVSPTSITQGASATISWSSTNATGCTAGGSWSGSQAISGTLSVTPTTTGTLSYTLVCTGAGGTANGSTSLTVNAPAPSGSGGTSGTSVSHGGGGSFDVLTVLGLTMLAVARLWMSRRRLAEAMLSERAWTRR